MMLPPDFFFVVDIFPLLILNSNDNRSSSFDVMCFGDEMQDADYQGFNFRSLSYDVGCPSEEEPFRGDTGAPIMSTLDAIELDTPPEMMSTPPLLDTPLEVNVNYFVNFFRT